MNVRRRPVTSSLLLAGLVTGAAVGGRDLLRRQAATARDLIGKPLGEQGPTFALPWGEC